jgi:flavodoxin I
MKGLIVYDSFFGNTEQIAHAVASVLSSEGDIETLRVSHVKPEQLTGLDLLIVGSPTRAFRPTPAISRLLGKVPTNGLCRVKVAAFDTRISLSDMKPRILRFLVRLLGYAAEPISKQLKRKGGELTVPPEGFLVEGKEGPLKEGELERASDWARQIGLLSRVP